MLVLSSSDERESERPWPFAGMVLVLMLVQNNTVPLPYGAMRLDSSPWQADRGGGNQHRGLRPAEECVSGGNQIEQGRRTDKSA